MKKAKHYLKILFSSLFGFVSLNGFSQPANGLYGIFVSNPNPVHISKADLTTGNLSNLADLTIALGSYVSNSLTTNAHDGLIYASNGHQLATFDINTGVFIDSISIYPLSPNEEFVQIEFNSCDSNLYGMVRLQSPIDFKLGRLDPSTGQLTVISPQTVGGIACIGCGYAIDPYQHTYYAMTGNLVGIDIYTGLETVNITPVCPSGYVFSELRFDCKDSTLYGLSANITTMSKYFATIEPVAGNVSHISAINNLNNYFWKQAYPGQTMDPGNGEYYFVSGSTNVIGVDILSGAANTVQPLSISGNESFLNITYYPQCLCGATTGINEDVTGDKGFSIFPNPANTVLHIKLNQPANITITDLLGQVKWEKNIQTYTDEKLQLDISSFSAGIYFIRAGDEVRKFVKE